MILEYWNLIWHHECVVFQYQCIFQSRGCLSFSMLLPKAGHHILSKFLPKCPVSCQARYWFFIVNRMCLVVQTLEIFLLRGCLSVNKLLWIFSQNVSCIFPTLRDGNGYKLGAWIFNLYIWAEVLCSCCFFAGVVNILMDRFPILWW